MAIKINQNLGPNWQFKLKSKFSAGLTESGFIIFIKYNVKYNPGDNCYFCQLTYYIELIWHRYLLSTYVESLAQVDGNIWNGFIFGISWIFSLSCCTDLWNSGLSRLNFGLDHGESDSALSRCGFGLGFGDSDIPFFWNHGLGCGKSVIRFVSTMIFGLVFGVVIFDQKILNQNNNK